MAGYIVLSFLTGAGIYRRGYSGFQSKDFIVRVFDAATFSGSILLAMGIVNERVLVLLGSTKPFLIIAAFIGFFYSVKALFPVRHFD